MVLFKLALKGQRDSKTCYDNQPGPSGWCGTCYEGNLEPGEEGYCDYYNSRYQQIKMYLTGLIMQLYLVSIYILQPTLKANFICFVRTARFTLTKLRIQVLRQVQKPIHEKRQQNRRQIQIGDGAQIGARMDKEELHILSRFCFND